MTEEKKRTATVLAVVLVVAILCSLCASLYSAKGIYDLKTEANAAQETTEDNVKIMNGEYEILSTTQISDAYKSGNTSGLSKKDQETLEMAKAVLEEVITDDMTTAYDKEKAIYDWMTSKLNYDTGVLQVIPQTSADCDNPYGVLKYHNAASATPLPSASSCRCWTSPAWSCITRKNTTPGTWSSWTATGTTWTSTPTRTAAATPTST